MSDFVRHNAVATDFATSDSWVILSPIEQSIKRKIEAVGTPLKDWDIQINYGIKTGYNEAFIITTEKRDEILSKCADEDERKRTDELIRPILRGRDIKRYGYDWANLWLIATFPARNYDIEQYQSVKSYLLSFAEPMLREAGLDWIADNYLADYCYQKLAQTGQFIEIAGHRIRVGAGDEKARKKTSNKWFETQDSISYWDDFSKPKIMYPNMTKFLPFYYDEKSFYQNDKSFMITGEKIAFLTAFLNSSLFKKCFIDNFPELQGGTRELRKLFFDKIPVLLVDQKIDDEFRLLLEQMQTKWDKSIAVLIDQKVCVCVCVCVCDA